MPNREELLRRQKALGDFGDFVLKHDDLQLVLNQACRLVAEALNADLAKVLEIEPTNDTALVRAGVGWRDGIVGKERLRLDDRSSEAFAIEQGEPVITQDIAQETRFHIPGFLKQHGVVALVNVPIFLPGRHAWGLLQVDARERREFEQEDIDFLKTYSMVLGPVIDRLNKAAGLRESEERYQSRFEAMDQGFCTIEMIFDGDGKAVDYVFLETNPAFEVQSGLKDAVGKRMREIAPDHEDFWFETYGRIARTGKPERFEHRAEAIGRWYHVFAFGVADPEQQRVGVLFHDISERKRAEEALRASDERRKLLVAELQHRVRNILAMIRSLISRTSAGKSDVQEFVDHLQARVDAMARTQAMLTRSAGAPVYLEDIIRDELVSHAASERRYKIAGPDVALSPKTAEILTLAVHELAANSVKYGALGSSDGTIAITWSLEAKDGSDWVHLNWRESGLELRDTQAKPGFGTELITKRIPYELRGSCQLELKPSGVVADIEFPLGSGSSMLQTDAARAGDETE